MTSPSALKYMSAVFITFSGNCQQALKFYQSCFGGLLQLDVFEQALPGYAQMPLVSGCLRSAKVVIRASDLVHHEGRIIGNYMAIYIHCDDEADRFALIKKLELGKKNRSGKPNATAKLVEIIDVFGVRWVLGFG